MTKAKESNTTRTLRAAVPAVAVMALTTPSADADPIFAAIDAHRETVGKFDIERERLAGAALTTRIGARRKPLSWPNLPLRAC